MKIAGEMDVKVQFEKLTKTLPLVIITGSGPSLLGRNWIPYISWSSTAAGAQDPRDGLVHHSTTDALQSILIGGGSSLKLGGLTSLW